MSVRRNSLIVIVAAMLTMQAGAAGEWGHIKSGSESSSERWTDYSEARPDAVPDAWLVSRLARMDGDEVMLRGANGGMLRWMPTRRLRYIYAVQQSIEKAAELEVALYITRGDTPNAAAGMRDGVASVFINFAMFDMIENNVDEWAALLGHEIAHLKLKHIDKQNKRSIPMTILKTVGQAVLASDPLASTASGLLVDGIGMKFSRDAEREADYMGVIWAVESDYNPYGASYLHEKMTERSVGHPIPFLSSHPSGPERVETLKELADRLSQGATKGS